VDIDRSSGARGSRSFEQEVLATLESGYDDLDARLGLRPGRSIRVVVYDPAAFDAAYAGLFRFPAAGFTGDAIHVRGDVQVTAELVRVLHHELVHAALAADAPSAPIPGWLNEGLAEWFSARAAGQRLPSAGEWAALERAHAAGALPPLAALASPSFGGLGPRDAALAYLESFAFVAWLAARHGERALRDGVRDFVRTGDLERALRRQLGTDLARAEAQFRAELGGAR
jgi:hypothetical protein